MNDFSFFFRYARIRTRRYFSRHPIAKIITALLFFALVIAIGIAVYAGVHAGFAAMNQQTYGRQTLPLYTYEIFFLVMSYLMLLSATASSFFALSRHEDDWIAATPKFKTLLSSAVRNVFLTSLWPLLVLGLPAILALRSVYEGGAVFILAGIIGLIVVAGIACSLAIALVLILAEILHGFHALHMRSLVAATVACIILLTYAVLRQVMGMDVSALFVSGSITATEASITGIAFAFRFFPTQLMAYVMLNLQNGAAIAAWKDIGWLAIIAALVGLVIYFLSFGYLPVWQKLEEGSFEARTKVSPKKSVSSKFLLSAKTSVAAMFYKEAITNVRNLKNVTWLLFMLSLWAIQATLNIFLRSNIAQYGIPAETGTALIQSLQLITATFFVSSFVLRFVLPSFSGERRMAWILGTAPISLRHIFFSKLSFYGVSFLILGMALGIVNSAMFGTSLLFATEFLAVLATLIIAITTFGLSLGTLFPDTESDDPEVVSTSLPGLAFTFIALLYGGFGAWLYYLGLNASEGNGIALFIIVSLALSAGMIIATTQQLKIFNPFAEARE